MSGEATWPGADGLAWFKSSHSSEEGGECVEVAASPAGVYVRDSKDEDGPILAFGPAAWSAFIAFAAERLR